jgi:predicted DNA-binding transcriptional regulator YafY
MTMPDYDAAHVRILYTNHRGETIARLIVPQGIRFDSNPWHPEAQWFLDAWDVEQEAPRTFAVTGIRRWEPCRVARQC